MIKITIDDKEVKKILKDLSGKVKNLRPAMKNIAGIMKDAVEQNFEKEGRQPEWKKSKRAEQQGGQTLQDTGQLAASISSRYDGNSAQVGTNKPYAAIHQFGGRIPARTVKPKNAKALKIPVAGGGFIFRKKAHLPAATIPARPFLKLQDNDLEEIKDAIVEYLKPP